MEVCCLRTVQTNAFDRTVRVLVGPNSDATKIAALQKLPLEVIQCNTDEIKVSASATGPQGWKRRRSSLAFE
jgi:enhancing lycopene biosynthesis protein 2